MSDDSPDAAAPTARPQKRLLIFQEVTDDDSYRRALESDGFQVDTCNNWELALTWALEGNYEVILLDLVATEPNGLRLLEQLRTASTSSQVIVLAGEGNVESAVAAMKLGASDYLLKPLSPDRLKDAVEQAFEKAAVLPENTPPVKRLKKYPGLEGIIGESPAMQQVFDLIRRVAPTDGSVLITGESGTGKEMVARAIHRLSRRKDKPLLACDCSALVPTLLESELFGHVKGSFSGAIATKQGLFEAADKGTLFLDEVGNLSLETQGKLLRVLETRRVKKVGDTTEREVDIRLIAATNRDLWQLVQEGSFREDLYYRLNVVPIYLPPLRERHGDIPLLATVFLENFCRQNQLPPKRFTSRALAQLESYHWPGNVRELKNVVERVAILWDTHCIDVQHLPAEVRMAPTTVNVPKLPQTWNEFKVLKQQVREAAVQQLERRFLIETLERFGGNVSRAAKAIGLQRTNLHKLLRRHSIKASQFSPENNS